MSTLINIIILIVIAGFAITIVFGWILDPNSLPGTDKRRDKALSAAAKRLDALPPEIKQKIPSDDSFHLFLDTKNAKEVNIALERMIFRASQRAENVKRFMADHEEKTFGPKSQRRVCGKCGIQESLEYPLNRLLDHLLPIDVKPYCSYCFGAAHRAADAEYMATLKMHQLEAQRRASQPDEEL